jgi:ferric-dicitrate binding protein FerR (iron transport regulator)
MTKEEYILLYKKHLSGTATPHELELLAGYKDEFDIEKFDDDETIPDQELIKNRIYQQIENRLSVPKQQVRSVRRRWLGAVAAAILLIWGIGLFYMNAHTMHDNNQPAQVAKAPRAIVPGRDKAVLILDNGNKVDLDQTANGQIAQAGKTKINKVNNGQLQYEKAISPDSNKGKLTYNTIVTPRGGQYRVVLPDGTSVWLNSATSLRYPTAFTGHERHVELIGEAYFEVAKNKELPFTVNAGKVDVKVLGTHFNIAAYDDEPSTKTTLLEGSVRMSGDNQSVMLTPGQQAVAEKNGRGIITKAVNVQDAIAWKNGYFLFKKDNIQSAMRKIARWYDVDVVYEGKISDKLLGGSVMRTQNIDELLSYLETIGIARFKIEGRRIMVKAN